MIECIFAENGPLECGIESSFSGTGRGAKGDFRCIFDPNPCKPSGMGTDILGMIGCIFAENAPLESGIESSFSGPAGVLRMISLVQYNQFYDGKNQ